jgi:hypothetical protein
MINLLRNLLHRHGQPDGQLVPIDASLHEIRFRWQTVAAADTSREYTPSCGPCRTSQIWRPSQAGHLSNGAWLTVDQSGAVYLTCLHPQCMKREQANRHRAGLVPLSLLDQVRTGIATLDQSDHNVPDLLSSGTSRATRNWNTARSDGPSKRSVCSTDSPDAPLIRSAPDATIESSTLLEEVRATADGLLPDSIPASEWQGRPGHSFSRERNFAQVAREKQSEKDIPFHT